MFSGCKTLRSRQSVCFGHVGSERGGGKISLSLPRVNLKILFWLRPEDSTRQMETPWELKV